MPATVERKIFFFKIEAKKNDVEIPIPPIFEYIHNLPFTEAGRYLLYDDLNYRAIYPDSRTFPIRAKIGTKRRTDLPMMEVNGITEDITIPEGGGLLEATHFIIFPNNILGCEFNFHGPRPTSLRKYLLEKASNFVDDFVITSIIRHDITDQMENMGEIKSFVFKAHRDTHTILREMAPSLASTFRALRDTSDAQFFEIVLRNQPHSRKPIQIPFIGNISSWLGQHGGAVQEFKINAYDNRACDYREFDLLKEYIYSVKSVVRHDDVHRRIDSDSMYAAINSAYHELLPEIQNLI